MSAGGKLVFSSDGSQRRKAENRQMGCIMLTTSNQVVHPGGATVVFLAKAQFVSVLVLHWHIPNSLNFCGYSQITHK